MPQRRILHVATALAAFLVATLFAGSALARGDRGADVRAFEGLWQAIDTFDGSTQRMSIACERRDACDVRLNDTAFTLSCPNEIGFADGTGRIHGNVLRVELTLRCTSPDGSSSVAGSQDNEFVLDRRRGTLTNLNDDPVEQPNVFYRISR